MTYCGVFCFLNHLCIRKSTTLRFMGSLRDEFMLSQQNSVTESFDAFLSPCWVPWNKCVVHVISYWLSTKYYNISVLGELLGPILNYSPLLDQKWYRLVLNFQNSSIGETTFEVWVHRSFHFFSSCDEDQ